VGGERIGKKSGNYITIIRKEQRNCFVVFLISWTEDETGDWVAVYGNNGMKNVEMAGSELTEPRGPKGCSLPWKLTRPETMRHMETGRWWTRDVILGVVKAIM
jgi:hypothetical protein